MTESAAVLDYGALLTGIGGGLALFLYGMRKMTESLRIAAAGGMKNLLAKLTTNRFTGALAGALVTAVVQSSSVTTVMVVGFVTAGLMTFGQSIGVIMGANVGTTITAQIIAFKITEYALLMIAVGFLLELVAKTNRLKHFGIMLMGLGLLFFGMQLMSDAALPLRTHAPFIEFMQDLRHPVMGIVTGLVFTALVQSSSATTGIVIVLASQGLISLEAGIALVFGSNVGTCVTAMLAALGKPREAVKAAVVHVIFNLGGVLLFVAFIPEFAQLVREFSPRFEGMEGATRMAAEVPRQIANAHTVFNVVATLLFLGFANVLARLVEYLVPSPAPQALGRAEPVYLHAMYLDQPAVALDRVRQEIGRLGAMAIEMSEQALTTVLSGDERTLDELRALDNDVDRLHGEIVRYLGSLSKQELVEPLPGQLQASLGVANYLEHMGDVVETGFVGTGRKRLEFAVRLDEDIAEALKKLHDEEIVLARQVLAAFLDNDTETAKAVLESKAAFNRKVDRIRLQLAHTLAGGERAGYQSYRLGMDTVEHLKQLHRQTRRIARFVVEMPQQAGSEPLEKTAEDGDVASRSD